MTEKRIDAAVADSNMLRQSWAYVDSKSLDHLCEI
jgi:hypothetical protein